MSKHLVVVISNYLHIRWMSFLHLKEYHSFITHHFNPAAVLAMFVLSLFCVKASNVKGTHAIIYTGFILLSLSRIYTIDDGSRGIFINIADYLR